MELPQRDSLHPSRERPESGRKAAPSRPAPPSIPPPSLAPIRSAPPSGPVRTESGITLSSEALRNEEMGRVRVTVQVLLGIACLGLLLTPIMGGDPLAKRVFVFGLLWAVLTMGALLQNAHDPTRYSIHFVGAASVALSIASSCSVYYMGAFSPAAMVGALGLYIFCLGGSMRWSAALYTALAVPHGLLAVFIIWKVTPDRGLVRSDGLSLLDQIAVQACVQAVYAVAFLAGRGSRSKLEGMVGELEVAVRRIAQRDALLSEAKRELERAVCVGGEGRFTEQTIGSFRLGNIIGRGGMGEVYEATHVVTHEEAAVKLLRRGVAHDPESLARFAREAQAASALDSPYVVRVLELPHEHAAIPYLAMERLRGEDLASMLRRERRLSAGDLVKLARHVGRALDAARACHVVHRDIKPQNLFLTRAGDASPVWKVLDFGVSKLLGEGSLTRDQLIGTPEYMAPEQAAGTTVDARADLYALCAVLYRCVASRAPFVDSALPALVHKVIHTMPPRPTSLAQVPDDLDAFLAIGLAKRPEDRFQTGAELSRTLEAALQSRLPEGLRVHAAALQAKHPWAD